MYHTFSGGTGIPTLAMRYPLAGIGGICVAAFLGFSPTEERTVSFTFDDAKMSVFEEAYPVFNKYDVDATIFVNMTANRSPEGFMQEDQLRDVFYNGLEIGNHGRNHLDLTTVEDELLAFEILTPLIRFLPWITNDNTFGFAAPFGEYTEREKEVIASGHLYSVRAYPSAYNLIDADLDRYELARYSLDAREGLSTDPVVVCQEVLDSPENSWFIFMGHNLVGGTEELKPEDYAQTAAFYDGLLGCLVENGVNIQTVRSVVETNGK